MLAGCYPQEASAAEEFTGKQFLEWPRDSQNSLITYSITMTAIIGTQTKPEIAKCLDEWYPLDPAITKARQDLIIKTIGEYPDYHPQAIVLAVVQKQCGYFKDKRE